MTSRPMAAVSLNGDKAVIGERRRRFLRKQPPPARLEALQPGGGHPTFANSNIIERLTV